MLFVDYLPAELKICKSRWYVAYHVKNPKTGKLHRKTIKVNRIKNTTDRKKYGRKLVLEINRKLESGWNPFIEQEAPRGYTKLVDALNTFLRTKQKELRSKDTLRTYQSQTKIFQNYIKNIVNEPDMAVIEFDNYKAKIYMDYLYNERKLGGRAFNNSKSFCVMVFNYFIENLYCKANPFIPIRKKQVIKKTREIIDSDTRKKIKEYLLEKKEYGFLAVIMLCFYGLLRPKEICLLKSNNINIKQMIIHLNPEITKDKDNRIVTICDELLQALLRININSIPKNHYLFSLKFVHGIKPIDTKYIGRRWEKLRKEIGMPMKYQFYSLKDSGIVQMFKDGINPLDIRDQAGHATVAQTNEYAIYANPQGSEQILTKSSEF